MCGQASCRRRMRSGRTTTERKQLFDWIELDVFKTNPADPDPGRVTLRRLNRVEYRNTIRDLMGVDYDTSSEFPPDDSGYGFDNIGDAMSVSPLLMEKYLNAARAIVARSGCRTKEPGKEDKKAQEAVSPYFCAMARRRRMPRNETPMPARFLARLSAARIGGRWMIRRSIGWSSWRRKRTRRQARSFEAGIGGAMVAVLASPRFLFRVEEVAAKSAERATSARRRVFAGLTAVVFSVVDDAG